MTDPSVLPDTFTLRDLLPEADMTAAVEAGLVSARQSGDFVIYNYTPAAVYTPGAWENPVVRQCRGIIANANTGEVVARPWAKFFNHNQAEAGPLDLDAPVEVTDKLDGSLGIIWQSGGFQHRVATRGSLTSEQAFHATERLRAYGFDLDLSRVTPLVEIIYPENRIVCDYGDRDELVLLGGVERKTGAYLGPDETAEAVGWEGPVVEVFTFQTLKQALEAPPRIGAEGLCVRFPEQREIVKIKQEDYVRLHRIVTGLSVKSIWRHMVEHGVTTTSFETLLAPLPDEFHDWTRSTWDELEGQHNALFDAATTQHAAILTEMSEGWTRKDYAQRAVPRGDVRTYLFLLLDGRDPSPAIVRAIEPSGNRQPRDWETE